METNRFEKTVAILVKAYFEGTLEHTNCRACAVGNIVAARLGIQFIKNRYGMDWSSNIQPHWFDAVVIGEASILGMDKESSAAKQCELTGYTVKEVARIEYAFERADDKDDETINGLLAVVDVLASIDNIDLSTTQHARSLFNPRVEAKQ